MKSSRSLLRLISLSLVVVTTALGDDDAIVNVTKLECSMRKVALDFAVKIQPWQPDIVFRQVQDALQIKEKCGEEQLGMGGAGTEEILMAATTKFRGRRTRRLGSPIKQQEEDDLAFCKTHRNCVFIVSSSSGSDKAQFQQSSNQPPDGSILYPYPSVHDALEACRRRHSPTNDRQPCTMVFRKGIHTLNETLVLGPNDTGLQLQSYPGELAWLSGGIPITVSLEWNDMLDNNNNPTKVKVVDLSSILQGKELPRVASLFTTQARLVRARYPNSNPEVDRNYLPNDLVTEWEKPPKGKLPTFDYVDFSQPSSLYPNAPIKNDSTMEAYNVFASGSGGVCADLWGGEDASSYWCSNASAGGWAFVDKEAATTGQLGIPVGMYYNQTDPVGQRIDSWTGDAVGGIVFAWHSQSWAMHMFEIKEAEPGHLKFAKHGGNQGGRNWCRCDQCSFPSWCGQRQDPPDNTDDRLVSGSWLVENVLSELDQPGEFYFDPTSSLLYLYPNTTDGSIPTDLRFALLETLISVKDTTNITISGLGFRDAAPTFMAPNWSAPSGGDWSLHRGGAIFIENATRVHIGNSHFRRLDGTAVFLSRYTRHVTIKDSYFSWLGENAVATWGETDGFNATNPSQPMDTLIEGNLMRELGIFEKQSSGVGIAKAAHTVIRGNMIFNVPRAAINFNDMMGGGDIVKENLLFNTCGESGDHGPINSWDRQPYLTNVTGTPSFNPIRREIGHNFIIANYGSAQGVDNDDGSSWYHVYNNVWYDSDGFKMDYGGHDSIFEDNLLIGYPGKANCIGFGSFYEGHGHVVRRNVCIGARSDARLVRLWGKCDPKHVTLEKNLYLTPNGTDDIHVCNANDDYTLAEVQSKFGNELGSVAAATPSDDTIAKWARELLWNETKSLSPSILGGL